MPTIKDVAEAAGVSVATVSYVLNGTKRVSSEVETRVREIARRLNYLPNANAQNLRRSENLILGYELPVPEPRDISSLMEQFAYGLTLAAARVGYHLITFASLDPCDQLAPYRQLILSGRVDGFILSNTNWRDERVEFLLREGFPFVAFGRTGAGFDFAYVDVDGYDGLRQVTEHLIDKGHERIAFIGWPSGSFSGDNRHLGYRDTMQKAGLKPQPFHTLRAENSVENGYNAAAKLMQTDPAPTAIACVSDVIALGAIRYLTDHGYRVSQDVAVTGFDDLPLSSFTSPSLTSVSQPIAFIEERLIQILLGELIDNPVESRQVVLKPTLIIRESSNGL